MKKSLIAGITAAVVGFGTIAFAAPGNAVPESSHAMGQILVKFNDHRSAPKVLQQHGLSEGPGVGSTGARLITVPAGKELQLIQALGRNPAVEYAELDPVVTATAEEPDPDYSRRQYALDNTAQSFWNTLETVFVAAGTADADVDAVEARAVTTGAGVRVAVLDSGVANDNADIFTNVVAHRNFTNGETGNDNYGHGTHVAGIVAAQDNASGVTGVCPGCDILDGKVLNDSGIGSTSSLADGINWAVSNGAKVINMSLAVRASRTLEAAVNNAWNKGVVLVAAAGNGNNETKIYPAAYPNVIAVAATDNRDLKASFSTYGASWVDIAAPGANVYSTFPKHPFVIGTQNKRAQGYDIGNGTSMAAPIVAATAALAWSKNPGAASSVIRTQVESTADRIEGTGTLWAHGRVNANNAVTTPAPAPGQ